MDRVPFFFYELWDHPLLKSEGHQLSQHLALWAACWTCDEPKLQPKHEGSLTPPPLIENKKPSTLIRMSPPTVTCHVLIMCSNMRVDSPDLHGLLMAPIYGLTDRDYFLHMLRTLKVHCGHITPLSWLNASAHVDTRLGWIILLNLQSSLISLVKMCTCLSVIAHYRSFSLSLLLVVLIDIFPLILNPTFNISTLVLSNQGHVSHEYISIYLFSPELFGIDSIWKPISEEHAD